MAATIAPAPTNSVSWDNTSNYTFSYHFKGGLCALESTRDVNVYAVFLTLLALAATIENLIFLMVLCKNAVLRQPSNLILGNLALLDLITTSVVTPIKVWLTVKETKVGNEEYDSIIDVADAFYWLFYGVEFISLSTVLMISIDRFFRVFFLNKFLMTTKKLLCGLVLAWSLPLAITVGLAANVFTTWLGLLALVYFLFCIIGMIAAYAGMLIMLQRHRSKINDTTASCFRKSIEDEKRSVRTTLIIMCTFVAMNLPPVVSIGALFMDHFSKALCALTFFAMLGNSAVNPIIYFIRVPLIRRHVLEFLGVKVLREYDPESDDYLTVFVEDEPDLGNAKLIVSLA